MNRHPIVHSVRASGGSYLAPGRAYVFFCISIVFTVALLTFTSLYLPPRALQTGEMKAVEFPVAMIQLIPNRAGLCRHLVFHNDTGHFEEGETGQCHGLIPAELLVDTVRVNRTEALGRVFKFQ
jgi:hypothetical protein